MIWNKAYTVRLALASLGMARFIIVRKWRETCCLLNWPISTNVRRNIVGRGHDEIPLNL